VDYSALNPVVWGSFIGFSVLVWLAVRLHGARHPGYPGTLPGRDG